MAPMVKLFGGINLLVALPVQAIGLDRLKE